MFFNLDIDYVDICFFSTLMILEKPVLAETLKILCLKIYINFLLQTLRLGYLVSWVIDLAVYLFI